MLIQLQPMQISLLWENIRESAVKACRISEKYEAKYSTALLKNLLSGKFQCWLVFKVVDGERQMHAIGITAIEKNHLFDFKELHILSLYGLRLLDDELAKESFVKFLRYAKETGCTRIKMETSVGRIKQLAEARGFTNTSECYELDI